MSSPMAHHVCRDRFTIPPLRNRRRGRLKGRLLQASKRFRVFTQPANSRLLSRLDAPCVKLDFSNGREEVGKHFFLVVHIQSTKAAVTEPIASDRSPVHGAYPRILLILLHAFELLL